MTYIGLNRYKPAYIVASLMENICMKGKIKKKIPKIVLIISFIPYAFCLLYGIYSVFAGFTFFGSTSYGFDAFTSSIFIMGYLLCCYPVIPVCLIYQIVYLSVFIIKRSKAYGKQER